MPRAAKQMDKEDPEYLEKRAKNNEAIKKSREKARAKAKDTQQKVDHLKKDNKRLEDKITVLGQEMQFLKEVFLAHAGAQNSAVTDVTGNDTTANQGDSVELLNNILSEIDETLPGTSQ